MNNGTFPHLLFGWKFSVWCYLCCGMRSTRNFRTWESSLSLLTISSPIPWNLYIDLTKFKLRILAFQLSVIYLNSPVLTFPLNLPILMGQPLNRLFQFQLIKFQSLFAFTFYLEFFSSFSLSILEHPSRVNLNHTC